MRRDETLPVFGDGSNLRDFTYVDDLVDGFVRALDSAGGFRILNLGAGGKISVLEVIKQLERALDTPARIEWLPAQTGDVPRTWADCAAAREALGYVPRVDFETGLARFIAWLEDPR